MRPSNKLVDLELRLAVHALNELSQLFLIGVAMNGLCELVMFAHAWTLEWPSVPPDDWSEWPDARVCDHKILWLAGNVTSSYLQDHPSYLTLIWVLVMLRTSDTRQSPCLSFRSTKQPVRSHQGAEDSGLLSCICINQYYISICCQSESIILHSGGHCNPTLLH